MGRCTYWGAMNRSWVMPSDSAPVETMYTRGRSQGMGPQGPIRWHGNCSDPFCSRALLRKWAASTFAALRLQLPESQVHTHPSDSWGLRQCPVIGESWERHTRIQYFYLVFNCRVFILKTSFKTQLVHFCSGLQLISYKDITLCGGLVSNVKSSGDSKIHLNILMCFEDPSSPGIDELALSP